jgi:Holliday junction resolvase RusA-like endonuclease
MKIEIKEKLISVNSAWKGRRYKTQEYKNLEEILLVILPRKKMLLCPIEIKYFFYLKNYKRIDIDNLIKGLQDILQKKGYFKDDNQIYKSTQYKIASKKDKTIIEIKELSKEDKEFCKI